MRGLPNWMSRYNLEVIDLGVQSDLCAGITRRPALLKQMLSVQAVIAPYLGCDGTPSFLP